MVALTGTSGYLKVLATKNKSSSYKPATEEMTWLALACDLRHLVAQHWKVVLAWRQLHHHINNTIRER
jgi:hypothetical protein